MNTHQIASRTSDWQIVAVAIALIATGFALLSGDVMGILSLDRIQNLWPVTLILVGVVDWFSSAENRAQIAAR